jgi:DNA-binding CsgD family transcriptional regulator
MTASTEPPGRHVQQNLTGAERDVAALAAAGMSNAEIARLRGTSDRTVANQMASILRKLQVGSRHYVGSRLETAAAP